MSDQFLPEDFAEVARLLRVNLNRTGGFQAVCSNNHNVILSALDQAAASAERRAEANPPIDWDLVQWRSAFRAASAATDAKLTALLLDFRAEAVARGTESNRERKDAT